MGEKPTQTMRILLADDDADVRETIKLVLQMDHHEVLEACDGRQAVQLLNSHEVDLVITDYVMPEMSGDLLALEVKKQHPTTPVIMITANADLLPNPLPGVDQVLSKPFLVKDLIGSVREASHTVARLLSRS